MFSKCLCLCLCNLLLLVGQTLQSCGRRPPPHIPDTILISIKIIKSTHQLLKVVAESLAVQNSSIGDLVPCLLCLTPLTIRVFTTLQSNPRDFDLWDICSEWWEDMTWPKIWPTQRQWQRQIHLENTYPWDIWSEWWEDMIWQNRQRKRHFENIFKGRSLRLVTFETFHQSDEETWHDQQRQRHSENTTTNTYEIEVWNCCHFRQLRTWVHDNHCYLGIKSDTGQPSQSLRCLSISIFSKKS